MTPRRRQHCIALNVASLTSIVGILVASTASSFSQKFRICLASSDNHNRCNHPCYLRPRWSSVEIDYSAATEYIQAHYGLENGYFNELSVLDETSKKFHVIEEDIYDARQGVFNDDLLLLERASLACCGFELKHAPTDVSDWTDMEQVRELYLPELNNIISESFRMEDENQSISHVIWYQPMFRGEGVVMSKPNRKSNTVEVKPSSPTAPVASMVHIDTDIGALDTRDIVKLVQRNRVLQDDPYPFEEIETALNDGRRFAVVNVWRNADFDHSIHSAPLGLLVARYKSGDEGVFPGSTIDWRKTRWYTYSSMKSDECLVFRQYDRSKERPSDLWHCALPITFKKEKEVVTPPRRSFDIRALVVFDQKVPPNLDRFSDARLRPILSFEESKSFCRSQAQARMSRSDNA